MILIPTVTKKIFNMTGKNYQDKSCDKSLTQHIVAFKFAFTSFVIELEPKMLNHCDGRKEPRTDSVNYRHPTFRRDKAFCDECRYCCTLPFCSYRDDRGGNIINLVGTNIIIGYKKPRKYYIGN